MSKRRGPTLMPIDYALNSIRWERDRQERLKKEGKFTTTCADAMSNGARLAVLAEEFGEVARAILELGLDGEESFDKHGKDLRKELVQVASVAVAWIEGLDTEKKIREARTHD